MNIAVRIFEDRDSSKVAFANLKSVPLTYGAALALVDAQARRLIDAGVARADRVALFSPRGESGLLGFLAVSSLAACCPIDPRLKPEEISSALKGFCVRVVADATGEPHIEDLAVSLGLTFVDLRDAVSSRPGASPAERAGILRREAASMNDVALILQTSGTTSKPKLVPLTHANIFAAASAIGRTYDIDQSDLCLNPMPHHHVHGLISAGLSSLVAGAAQYCATSFSPRDIEGALSNLNPTWFTGSPAFHLGLLDHFKLYGRRPPPGRLRFIRSSSAPFPASAISQYEALFGVPLLENYGMTESSSTICTNPLPPGARKAGSVGLPMGSEIRVVGPDGGECRIGREGEIQIKGPSVIRSYAEVASNVDNFEQDWFRTGDIGRFDEDGYLFVLGRTKEMIKRGGHSVFPMEVDSAIIAHPDVAEAISFAISHPTLGEELVAAFVRRSGVDVDPAELRGFLEGRLSTFKIPAAIFCINAIPKNATGKTVRREMSNHLRPLLEPKGTVAANDTEQFLLKAWRSVLHRGDLGVTDNVFLLGADPLRAEQVCKIIKDTNNAVVGLKDILRNPTVRQQRVLVEQSLQRTGSSGDP